MPQCDLSSSECFYGGQSINEITWLDGNHFFLIESKNIGVVSVFLDFCGSIGYQYIFNNLHIETEFRIFTFEMIQSIIFNEYKWFCCKIIL